MEVASQKKSLVLIVDDEALGAMGLQLYFSDLGFEVCPLAFTGEEAITAATELRPRVVLMDVNLPGAIGGIEAAQTIYQQFKIPSILVSGYSESQIKEKHLELPQGIIGYLGKPYTKKSLEKLLQTVGLLPADCEGKDAEHERN